MATLKQHMRQDQFITLIFHLAKLLTGFLKNMFSTRAFKRIIVILGIFYIVVLLPYHVGQKINENRGNYYDAKIVKYKIEHFNGDIEIVEVVGKINVCNCSYNTLKLSNRTIKDIKTYEEISTRTAKTLISPEIKTITITAIYVLNTILLTIIGIVLMFSEEFGFKLYKFWVK